MPSISIDGVSSSYNQSGSNDFYDVPTNPKMTLNSYANGDKLYTIIYEDGTISNDEFKRGTGLGNILTEFTNLHITEGYILRCLDNNTGKGVNFNPTGNNSLDNYEYYVLIHSDNELMYHFAKITSILTNDVAGDGFTFSPRMGDEIPKGVKFKIFKGPHVTSLNKIVAISAGISKDIPILNIARPYFYFYDDKLDKKGELNHNTKYMLKSNISNDNTTYSGSSAIVVNTTNRVFLTVSDYRHKIIDYSKFSYNIKLVDKLRELDDPDIATSNESNAIIGQFTVNSDYNSIFINARRLFNDQITNPLDLTGPKRYVYYNFSPEENNRMPSIYEINIADSFDVKTGYASIKMIDSTKNLSNKVFNNDRLFVNQKIKEESFNDWVEVAEIASNNGLVHTLRADVERPNLYFGVNNEIKIGNTICIVNGVSSTNEITLWNFFGNNPFLGRLETESTFSFQTGVVFPEGTKVYRRRLNPLDGTFFTSAKIPSDRLDKLNGVIISNQYKNFYCTMGDFITNVDKDYGLLTINFENNLLDNDTAFRYIFGELLLNYQVFFGLVEEIHKKLENNQTIFEIQGRNTMSRLVDIVINKDTLFSSDFILSAESPYNDVGLEFGYASWDEVSASITFDSAKTLVAGDHLWNRGGYVGEVVVGGTGTLFTLVQPPSFKSGIAGNNMSRLIYKETNRNYILGKALASNRYTDSVTSLAGASDKGLYFKTGNKLGGSNSSQYTAGSKLVGLSQHDDINALGFNINGVESILEDLPFQTLLDGFDSPILNTLIDFTILDVKDNTNNKTVKLAPYMPLTLGREVENLSNFEYPFAGSISSNVSLIVALGSFGSYSNSNKRILLSSSPQAIDISKIRTLKVGEPLFANNNFIGRYIGDDVTASADGIDTVFIYVDRAVSLTSGDVIGYLNEHGNTVRSLHLINGGHLQNNRLIDLVSPTQNTYSPRLYNYDLNYTNNITQDPITSVFKYRNKPHRIFNLEKGTIGEKNYTLVNFISNNDITPFYADDAIFNYYADTYCAYPEMNGAVHQNKYPKASLGVQLPIGMRGIRPITFSNFADKRYYLSHANNKFLFALNPQNKNSFIAQTGTHAVFPNPLLVRDKLQQLDPRAARLFLYANRDKTFYSSRRKDSLLNGVHELSIADYGMVSLSKPKKTTHSIAKDSVFGNTTSLVNFDSDYQHSSIVSSNKTLSALKRFSIMRLTECVFDSFMNPINPEFDISGEASVTASNIDMAKVHTSATQFAGTTYFLASNQMTMNGAVNDIVQGDIIIDETNNKILGQVSGISGGNNQNIDFYGQLQFVAINDGSNSPHSANDSKLSGFSYVAGDNIKYIKYADIARYVSIGGRLEDSILFKYGSDARGSKQPDYSPPNFHLLKGLIVNEDKLDAWGDYYIERTATPNIDSATIGAVDHMEQIRKVKGQTGLSNQNQYDIQNIMLPYCFHGIFRQGSTSSPNLSLPHPASSVNEGFWEATTVDNDSNGFIEQWNYEKAAQKEIMSWDIFRWIDGLNFGNKTTVAGVALNPVKQDRQKINSLKIVALKTFGTEDTPKGSISNHIVSPFLSYASLGYVFRYQEQNYVDNEGKSIIYPMLGTTIEAGADMESDNKVSSAGIYIGMKFHVSITGNEPFEDLSNNYKSYEIPMENELIFLKMIDLTGCYLVPSARGKRVENGQLQTITSTNTSHNLTINDNEIIYVVAHEYDLTSTSNGEVSILTTDKALIAGVQYKIMQPNPVCFWNNTPKKIQLNTLTSAYTKEMGSDSLISDPPCWEDYQTSGDFTNHSSKEGVQSMYVIADLDKVSGSDDLVLRTSSHLSTILNVDTEMCFSDGENNLVCHAKGVEGGILGNFLEIAEMKQLKGIVSATETFELEVQGDINTDSERAIIGTTVSISKDVEDTVEELLKHNDIKHTFTKETYDLFNTTNFKGTNLFDTINFLLNKKDKKLTYVEDTIKIVNFDSNDFIAQFSLSDDDITEIKTLKSKFNYFNEIIVFGKAHKSIRKNLKEIRKNGRKTLEINEPKLTTKEDVDELAQEKLLIHTRLQELIEVKIPLSKIHTLTVGETIILESKVAGLQPRPYIVLEKIQTFDGLVQLKLGEYLKGIEDILSNLISETVKTQSHSRDGVFDANENVFDLFDNLKIKEMHLFIRKKEVSGAFTLGFGTQLNTNANTLGFGGGSTTFTTLQETDL